MTLSMKPISIWKKTSKFSKESSNFLTSYVWDSQPNIPGYSQNSRTLCTPGGLIQTGSTLTPTTTCHFLSHLGQPRSLDQVVEFTQRRVSRKTLNVPEEVLRLRLKQTPEEEVKEWINEWVNGFIFWPVLTWPQCSVEVCICWLVLIVRHSIKEWMNEWMNERVNEWMNSIVLWPVLGVLQRFCPKGAQINSHHLWSVDHLPQWPHEGTVHPHQLLRVHLRAQMKKRKLFIPLTAIKQLTLKRHHPVPSYLVGLVEDDSDLVVLTFKSFDGLREFVRDVQLVSVKQQNDPVHPLPEPTQDLSKVIPCRHTQISPWARNGLWVCRHVSSLFKQNQLMKNRRGKQNAAGLNSELHWGRFALLSLLQS